VRSHPPGSGTRMPSTHPDHHPAANGPTAKQLRYLRSLANSRGQTFTYPRTKAQASAEIRRLQALTAQDRRDRAIERERLANTSDPRDSARVRTHEITGYGANARWTHHTTREERS